MRRVRLGRTGVEVPAIGFGTWAHGGPNVADGGPVGWTGGDDDRARRALVSGWELGLTHWDTADVYGEGHAETLIGSVWDRVPREEIFLATKVGYDRGGFAYPYHPELIESHLHRSLANLATERIDLYYFHHCDFGPDGERLDDALALFHRFREQGKIRFIGLSDWDSAAVARYAPRVDPEVVQVYRTVVDDPYRSSGLGAWVEAHDAGVAFFSTLRHGLLLGKYEAPPSFGEGDVRNRVPEFFDRAFLARVRDASRAVANRFSGHPEPVLHALTGALLTGNPTACVLLGLRDETQVEAATTLGEPLTPEDAAWVHRAYDGDLEPC
jgi:aryl-alcohol dehydrogenase-like predicted oxidoreductase